MTLLTPDRLAEIAARDSRFDHDAVRLWHYKVYEDRCALLSHVSALTAEIAALRREAERYRWLRTAGAWESEIGMDELSKDPAKFDAAIDSAMSGGAK